MSKLIELLNECSPERTVFYCVVGLIALAILSGAVSECVGHITSAFRR